jgi:hypothetical protein
VNNNIENLSWIRLRGEEWKSSHEFSQEPDFRPKDREDQPQSFDWTIPHGD